jgi:hypothetical protein
MAARCPSTWWVRRSLTDGQVSGIVVVLHDMTQERQYIANLSWQATHDALTGLANRREFEYRLEQALNTLMRQAGRHSLMFLDLDQFKLVNDTLWPCRRRRVAAAYLRGCCSRACAKVTPWRAWGRRIRRAAGELPAGAGRAHCRAAAPGGAEPAFRVEGPAVRHHREYWPGAYRPGTEHPGGVAAGCRHGLLHGQGKGRNRVQVYHADDSELSMRFGEMAWIQRLHVALEENRFCLYAQEIAPAGQEGPGHIEILLRLHDESGRTILPDSFIPAAERYGLMTALDRWVVRSVFR